MRSFKSLAERQTPFMLRPRRDERHWQRLLQAADHEVGLVLKALPAELAQRARDAMVSFEPAPGRALVNDGLDPDTLGLFVGLGFAEAESGAHDLPAQIILFLNNLWTYARGDTADFREEVRRTYLHELGHYLGLDEDDLWARDLD